ncbi:hypothetical protein EON63_00990 [archaeon]|nr:MAG: hypothetical protein EON63_00990 [archaeon]
MEEFKEFHTEASWNLSVDEKLLKALGNFSSKIVERTKVCIRHMDELSYEIADSEVSLKNTFNEFLLLGNTQFIENVSKHTTMQSYASPIYIRLP